MTLFIACILIYGFKLPGYMHAVAFVLWILHHFSNANVAR